MILALCTIMTFLLTAAGYLYMVKYYFHGSETDLTKENILKIDARRITYVTAAILSGLGINLMYLLIYSDTSVLTQVKILSMVMLLVPIAVIDLRDHIIPNRILIGGLILRLVYYAIELAVEGSDALVSLKSDFAGALIVTLFFMLCSILMKNSIGMGDVKLFGLMGLYQGYLGVMVSIFSSLLVAFILSVVLLISRKKKRNDEIPLGPSIFVGTYIAVILTGI